MTHFVAIRCFVIRNTKFSYVRFTAKSPSDNHLRVILRGIKNIPLWSILLLWHLLVWTSDCCNIDCLRHREVPTGPLHQQVSFFNLHIFLSMLLFICVKTIVRDREKGSYFFLGDGRVDAKTHSWWISRVYFSLHFQASPSTTMAECWSDVLSKVDFNDCNVIMWFVPDFS